MGCIDAREKIQNKISLLKLARFQIEKERKENLKLLEKLEGHPITRTPIPDYIIIENKNSNLNYKDEEEEEEE